MTPTDPFDLTIRGRPLLSGPPWIMGILNTTPDSFADAGRYRNLDAALRRAEEMLSEGADIIDVGGESTRPGAGRVDLDEELGRVVPVIQAITGRFDAAVSVDTSKPEVMMAAADAGAAMINDVRSLTLGGAAEAARDTGLPVCIMHMQGDPETMQLNPSYDDPVAEIQAFFRARIAALAEIGISAERLVIDPGFGFGKTGEQNLQLLRELDNFQVFGRPILVGLSRKSVLRRLTGRDVDERIAGSIALATLAVERGANIVRTHDVAETLDAARVVSAVMAG